jgi:hypothetical protein
MPIYFAADKANKFNRLAGMDASAAPRFLVVSLLDLNQQRIRLQPARLSKGLRVFAFLEAVSMRCLKLWTCVVHLTLLCLVSNHVTAAPALTTIQDTLYKADGTRFIGVAYIEWNSFQASDSSTIASSSVVVPISDGALRVRLVPTSDASAGAHYFVRYHAEGKVQFTETWNVIPSTTPVGLAAIRVANGTSTGGVITPPGALAINEITGLADELSARPVKGFAYAPDRVLKTGPTGALESVQGTLSDCIHVDGTTGACGGGASGGSAPGFTDQEVPTGTINGSNTVFTLTQAPTPAASLGLYRNGILMKAGIDYTLSSATITFGSLSVPQIGDLLLASYRLAASGGPGPIIGGNIEEGSITNVHVAANAGIVESKLALQFPTHSNANDPNVTEKAALGGTAGVPSAINKYVTDVDPRMTNARPAQSHSLLGAGHSDVTADTVQRGDLIIGSFATGTPKWTRLPLGGANRCLMSNGADAVWNTCLFSGFHQGSVPFTGADGALAEAPMHFVWDSSNRRLSVGSNLNLSTLTVHDGIAGGATTLTIRGGSGQEQRALQVWQNAAGQEQASVGRDGVLAVRAVEAVSSSTRAAWSESGTTTDPSVRADGDAWFHSVQKARKTFEGGQIHTAPQIVCAAGGSTVFSVSIASLGTCTIPAGLLQPGDRLAIRATWGYDGTAGYNVRWKWGGAVAGSLAVPGTVHWLDQKGEIALYDGGAILDGVTKGSDAYAGAQFVDNSTQNYSGDLTIGFEGNSTATGAALRLIQFTVIRYPAQSNP